MYERIGLEMQAPLSYQPKMTHMQIEMEIGPESGRIAEFHFGVV